MTDAEIAPEPARAAASARPIERVRGMQDSASRDLRRIEELRQALAEGASAHGYQFVDTPILEHTELFLRKSGGERIAQMYAFNHRGRDLALRPEFTAPVVRYYIEHLQAEPLPVRLMYAGPVFRYETPGAGRTRQFHEFGCELIGAGGPLADAEIIGLALEGLRRAGIARPHLVLGHIGVVIDFLAGLNIDQRAQDWLTWSMERLRKGAAGAGDLPPHLERLEQSLLDSEQLPVVDDALDEAAVAALLEQAGVQFQGGSRHPDEIVRGLFAKRRRRYDPQLLRDAAEFVGRLTRLSGPPGEVLGPLRQLVRERGLPEAPLDELDAVVEYLEVAGLQRGDVTIDLGMGRGLHYYTGMLFEVYATGRGGPQLCGGGRYDDLASILGARQPVAACGFSLGLERVSAATATAENVERAAAALVLQGDSPAGALRLAARLRAAGWAASVDLRNRNASATRRAAERQGYAAIVSRNGSTIEFLHLPGGEREQIDGDAARLPSPSGAGRV